MHTQVALDIKYWVEIFCAHARYLKEWGIRRKGTNKGEIEVKRDQGREKEKEKERKRIEQIKTFCRIRERQQNRYRQFDKNKQERVRQIDIDNAYKHRAGQMDKNGQSNVVGTN